MGDSQKVQPIENSPSTFLCGDGFPINLFGVNDRHFIGVFINRDGVPSTDYVHKITGANSVISLSAQIIMVFKTWTGAQLKTPHDIIKTRHFK